MVDWGPDYVDDRKISLTVHDSATKDRLATVNGLRLDAQVSDLFKAVCREAGLPIRPVLKWKGQALASWYTVEEVGLTDQGEVFAEVQQALVTASYDGCAKVWNMGTGDCEITLKAIVARCSGQFSHLTEDG
jgi:hypothetical protein